MALAEDLRWLHRGVQDTLQVIRMAEVDPALRMRVVQYQVRKHETALAIVGIEPAALLDVSRGSYQSEMDIIRSRLEALDEELEKMLGAFGERTV